MNWTVQAALAAARPTTSRRGKIDAESHFHRRRRRAGARGRSRFVAVLAPRAARSLLDVAKNLDIPLEHACGGSCACTTCHVIVREGAQNLATCRMTRRIGLDTAWDVTPHSRLGCQAVVRGDVVSKSRCTRATTSRKAARIQLGKRTRPQPPASGAAPKQEVRS